MTAISANPPQPLADLLTALEAAVHVGNRDRAEELQREIGHELLEAEAIGWMAIRTMF